MAKHTVREELYGVLAFVGFVWFVFAVGHVLPFRLESFGVTPRTYRGLVGIPAAPFLHESLGHLLSNTIPLMVLLLLLAGSNAQSWSIVPYIVLLSGVTMAVWATSDPHRGERLNLWTDRFSTCIWHLRAEVCPNDHCHRRWIPLRRHAGDGGLAQFRIAY